MNTLIVTAILAFLVSWILTPLVCRWALSRGLTDQAGLSNRKIHQGDTPRLGGIAIVLGFFTPLVCLLFVETGLGERFTSDGRFTLGIFAGGSIIALLGLYDDLYGASAKLKFSVQFVAATAVYFIGFQIHTIDLPFIPPVELGLLSYPVTLLWLVGVTNAVNLIDGLDGLAAGLALLATIPMLVLALVSGSLLWALICCALAGSLLGFLVFNFHPAKIFMGDTGSLFLGFTLAMVTVTVSQKGTTMVAFLTPILAMGVPIIDTLLAIARRAWRGQHLFLADKDHIHHRLMSRGLSHRNTVLVMYGLASALAALGLITAIKRDLTAGLALGTAVIIVTVLVRKLGYADGVSLKLNQLIDSARESEKTRKVNRQIRKVSSKATTAQNASDILLVVDELVSLVGANSAELSVRGKTTSSHDKVVRIWGEAQSPLEVSPVHNLVIRLAVEQEELGRLKLYWQNTADRVEHLGPTVEAGCNQIAKTILVHRDEILDHINLAG